MHICSTLIIQQILPRRIHQTGSLGLRHLGELSPTIFSYDCLSGNLRFPAAAGFQKHLRRELPGLTSAQRSISSIRLADGKAVPIYAGARDSILRRISSHLFSHVAALKINACRNRAQAFGHPFGRFPFTDKRVRTRRDGSLLTSIQMADKNNDQRGRADEAEFL